MPVAASVTLPEPTNSTLILLLARPGPEPIADLPTPRRRSRPPAVEHHAGARPDLLDDTRSTAVPRQSPAAGISGVQV